MELSSSFILDVSISHLVNLLINGLSTKLLEKYNQTEKK